MTKFVKGAYTELFWNQNTEGQIRIYQVLHFWDFSYFYLFIYLLLLLFLNLGKQCIFDVKSKNQSHFSFYETTFQFFSLFVFDYNLQFDYKSLWLNCCNITQVIWICTMSTRFGRTLTCYLIQLYLLKG